MILFEVGRLCVKLAGRDAGNKCVVVQDLGKGYVLVDGNVRRKKVNVKHLEPLSDLMELKEKASHEEVKKAFEKLGLPVWEKKSKKAAERSKKQKKRKEKQVKDEKKGKKERKIEETIAEANLEAENNEEA